jgi:hypothetical protein
MYNDTAPYLAYHLGSTDRLITCTHTTGRYIYIICSAEKARRCEISHVLSHVYEIAIFEQH